MPRYRVKHLGVGRLRQGDVFDPAEAFKEWPKDQPRPDMSRLVELGAVEVVQEAPVAADKSPETPETPSDPTGASNGSEPPAAPAVSEEDALAAADSGEEASESATEADEAAPASDTANLTTNPNRPPRKSGRH